MIGIDKRKGGAMDTLTPKQVQRYNDRFWKRLKATYYWLLDKAGGLQRYVGLIAPDYERYIHLIDQLKARQEEAK